VLRLRTLNLTRTRAEAVATIRAWLARVVHKYGRLAEVAAAIVESFHIGASVGFLIVLSAVLWP
jgi:hypothetical protein